MTTTEKNKLIAEFIGAKESQYKNEYEMYNFVSCIEDGENEQHYFKPEDMRFHYSWDWLMPVVEKILDISLNLDTMEMYYNITDSIPNIEQAYNACIDFILWYNKQNPA